MSRLLASITFASLLFAPLLLTAAEETEAETDAHKVALELAGAFANDAFKLRDGTWSGQIETGKARLIQVNLYAGNQYWFCLGATAPATRLAVTVYDETGQPMASEPYAEGSTAAAGFSPDASGPYFVKLEELEGAPASFCLVYSYK